MTAYLGVSLKHPQLSFLRIHIFPIPEITVELLRAILATSSLPELRELELDIAMYNRGKDRPSNNSFPPFGLNSTESPILSPTSADALRRLQIRFADGMTVFVSTRFFSLFGVEHRPGTLKVVGKYLSLF
jgi:hypothetical protein